MSLTDIHQLAIYDAAWAKNVVETNTLGQHGVFKKSKQTIA